MTKFDVTTIDNAKKHFPYAKISDFICWVHYSDDDMDIHPLGLGSDPDSALENSPDSRNEMDKKTSYSYSIVVPDETPTTPPTYVDFSVVFNNSDDSPSDYAELHDLLLVYSGTNKIWRGTFSKREAVLTDLAENGDLSNSLVIDQEIKTTKSFPLVQAPNFKEIDTIRQYANISEANASKLIGEDESYWTELQKDNQKMTICQWNIFLQTIDQHLAKQYEELE